MAIEISDKQHNDDGTVTWTETETSPDRVRTRTVTATEWDVTILNCYCCSCDPWISMDPYCRNHGGVYGTRPCDVHQMPGQADDEGQMPESVQAAWKKRKESDHG